MSFPISWIEDKLAASAQARTLAHAFILTGAPLEELERIFYRLAAVLLKSDDPHHPDLHLVRPESKSRRIGVDQIRALESHLYLKATRHGHKIAAVLAAERMCLPPAQAANAFLKTLEEPPDSTVIFLVSDRPEQFLPTIKSRCLTLEVQATSAPPVALPELWLEQWHRPAGEPAAQAYLRARLLMELFESQREQIEQEHPCPRGADKDEEDTWKALVQSHLVARREQALAELCRATWQRGFQTGHPFPAANACLTLDELRVSLARNMDVALAVERCCLKLAGLV